MNIGIIPGGDIYLSNKIFDSLDEKLNRDNCHEYLILFKLNMSIQGHDFRTYDMFMPNEIDILIVYRIDFMIKHYLKVMKHNSHCRVFYMMTEPPIISKLHKFEYIKEFKFDKIFTWNDDEIRKSNKIIKLNYVNPKIQIKSIPKVPFNKKKFIATIVGNKTSDFPNELYSERLNVVKCFSKKKESFSLFGRGWNFDNRKWIKKVWKGEVENKNDILKEYKFTLCFENSYGYEGYITEKIFDAFAAGSVPVYLGATNVTKYIPSNTFIDYSKINSPERLYSVLSSITGDEYEKYISNIRKFIVSDAYIQFCSISFYENISKHIFSSEIKRKRSYVELRFRLLRGLFNKWKLFRYIKRYIYEVSTNIC